MRALTVTLVALLLAGTDVPVRAQTANDVVDSVRAFAVQYQREAPSLVAREDYSQTATYPRNSQYREMTSELVMVRLPGTSGWFLMRDVLTVDKREVRDREARLLTLLQSPDPTALTQARKIAQESARFNLGRLPRTMNVPDVALEYLQPQHAARVAFDSPRPSRIDNRAVVVLGFKEVAGPTILRDGAGKDMLARGRVWAEPQSGAIVRTELFVEDRVSRGRCTVDFGMDARLGIRVPTRMTERYVMRGESIDAVARYSDFRRFTVSTHEKAGKPPGRE